MPSGATGPIQLSSGTGGVVPVQSATRASVSRRRFAYLYATSVATQTQIANAGSDQRPIRVDVSPAPQQSEARMVTTSTPPTPAKWK